MVGFGAPQFMVRSRGDRGAVRIGTDLVVGLGAPPMMVRSRLSIGTEITGTVRVVSGPCQEIVRVVPPSPWEV